MRYLAILLLVPVLPLRAQTASAETPPAEPSTGQIPSAQSTAIDPLDWNQRWDNYVQRTYNWKRIGIVGMETAFDQTFQLKKCGRPPFCFPQDFEGALARRTARTTIELGVGALLHEDLRRRPSNLPGFRQRLTYALIHAPLAKNRDGDWRPAYGRYAGSLGGFVVARELQGRPITGGRLAENFGWSFAAYFQDSLWAEFEPDLKRKGKELARRWMHHGSPPLPSDSPANDRLHVPGDLVGVPHEEKPR